MKKQKLSLNELKISSFVTAVEYGKKGGASSVVAVPVDFEPIKITTIEINPLPEQSERTVSCFMACISNEFRGCVSQIEQIGAFDVVR